MSFISLSHKRTLVIGGAGYVGIHLVSQLIATGRVVTILGRSAKPRYTLPIGAIYIAGDFSQFDLISNLLSSNEEVIHLAYATVPNTSFESPLVDLQENLAPTVQLFAEVAKRERKLILVSSGGTVYGEGIHLPISETHSTKPISPYGVTKLTLENYAYLYAATHGLKFVCVRPSNAFGVGQRPFVGQGFIATALASAMMKQSIKIFGRRGTVRDYLYVSDIASGIISALEHGNLSEVYNLGSGVGLSNLDVIELAAPMLQTMGCKIRVETLPERAFDVQTNILDSTKLKNETGWQPKINFLEGLVATRDWLMEINK